MYTYNIDCTDSMATQYIHLMAWSKTIVSSHHSQMASLVELSVATVALHTPVPERLAYIEYLPTFIRNRLFQKLSYFRLREMEVAWEAAAQFEGQNPRDGFNPLAGDKFLFDRETQHEWKARLDEYSCNWRLFDKTTGRARNSRHVFWENEFSKMFKRRSLGHVDELMEKKKLFVDVVREIELSSEDICKDNAEIILALRYLRSLGVWNFYQQDPCWETIRRLVKEHPHLTELKLTCGSLSDCGAASLSTTLTKPTPVVEKRVGTCRITELEFVEVNFQPEGYRMLVELVGEMPQLLQLRVERCIKNFDKKLLVNAALRLPALQRLFSEENMLEDDAFVRLAEIRNPVPILHLCLNYNYLSSKTVEAICRASVDGVLNLERLELSYNMEIRDPAIPALTSMLASPVVGSKSVLTHLDLSGCSFGLKGMTSLLLALGHNKTLTHLGVSDNDFDAGFGDVLADFLLTNSSVTHLEADNVHLIQTGVSARLLTALESNFTVKSLSLARNELHCDGASAIFGALIRRAQVKPFTFVDLSENEIELDGLKVIADILEGFINGNRVTQADSIRSTNGRDEVNVASRRRHRVDSSDKDQRSSFSQCDHIVPIEELRLLETLWCGSGHRRECTALIKSIQRCVGYREF